MEASGPAVVLGSTQPEATVDAGAAAAAGLDVVRRRSGGGAVLALTPAERVRAAEQLAGAAAPVAAAQTDLEAALLDRLART